ncbi:hypothetical protein EVA_05835 [gut metagenome]|uniref:Uncharacterized protein n=1 Tax=gut metagenome TaxID=749906 RepID=J9D0I8_9ZZZZ
MTHKNGVQHSAIVKFKVVLAQHGEAFAWAHFNGSLGRVEFAGNSLEQSRLTCAVSTNYTINISICKLHVDILIKDALSKLDGKI